MVFSDLVIIHSSMEQSTINSCTTGAIRSVLHRNRKIKQDFEITKIKRIGSMERADFALLRVQGEFVVSIETKTRELPEFIESCYVETVL